MTCSGVEPGNIFKGLTVSNANVTSFELFYTTYKTYSNTMSKITTVNSLLMLSVV